jgi:ubiquinone/menaquinone biosynthesis C-methylase UbiE
LDDLLAAYVSHFHMTGQNGGSMTSSSTGNQGQYALATGEQAVGRLKVLHSIYSPVGREVLLEAGIAPGMKVADFGCGTGTMTHTLASIIGVSGSVTGIDVNAPQLEQARQLCDQEGFENTVFVQADACNTGLPRNAFDFVYCRFLLLHLPDPAACLREMRDILRPGGILVVEDGDLASAASVPPTALDAFADLFSRLGAVRGVDYSLANRLCHLVHEARFSQISLKVHQPAERAGASGLLLKWSVQEAAPAFIDAGLIKRDQLQYLLSEMQSAADNPDVLALAPRMSLVWARRCGKRSR